MTTAATITPYQATVSRLQQADAGGQAKCGDGREARRGGPDLELHVGEAGNRRGEGQQRQDGQGYQASGGHLSPPGTAGKGPRQHAVGRQRGPEPARAGHEGVDGAERQHGGGDGGERGRQ